jgi:hypothetical protein
MNTELRALAGQLGLEDATDHRLFLSFGLACVGRVEHLLEEPEAIRTLEAFRSHLAQAQPDAGFDELVVRAQRLANQHQGSRSIDGAQHAAVSATYALAKAIAGKFIDAAEYAAYAQVYAYGGYAVKDMASFQEEYAWQLQTFATLARQWCARDSSSDGAGMKACSTP